MLIIFRALYISDKSLSVFSKKKFFFFLFIKKQTKKKQFLEPSREAWDIINFEINWSIFQVTYRGGIIWKEIFFWSSSWSRLSLYLWWSSCAWWSSSSAGANGIKWNVSCPLFLAIWLSSWSVVHNDSHDVADLHLDFPRDCKLISKKT